MEFFCVKSRKSFTKTEKNSDIQLNKCIGWKIRVDFHDLANDVNGLSQYRNQHLSAFLVRLFVGLSSSYSDHYLR